MPFYNTIRENPEQMQLNLFKTMNQEQVIMAFFANNKNKQFTPHEVHERLQAAGYKYLITSVRRAMTDLTNESKLVQISMKDERYNKRNITWQYNSHRNGNNNSNLPMVL